MSARETAALEFKRRYGGPPQHLVRAPGRVNLIGEHTDYNQGYVMPVAIDLAIWVALKPRADRRVRVTSVNIGETAEISLDDLHQSGEGWIEYLKGMAWALQQDGHRLSGWDGVLAGDIPIGAGLSSSAAFELAVAMAFHAAGPWAWDGKQIALLARKADREWLGIQSGIMDQLISAIGEAGKALLIDCRSLETRQIQLPPDASLIVMDTGTSRKLVESAYNQRVEECRLAVGFFKVDSLRDVSEAMLSGGKAGLDPVLYRRARHVVTENLRVLEAESSMRAKDPTALGKLMDASHLSLQADYEVSSEELNTIVRLAQEQPGCFGARMTGAGFGGSAVALVKNAAAETFVARVGLAYERETGIKPQIFICAAADGAQMIF